MTHEDRITDLERRIKELEEQVGKQVPWTTTTTIPWDQVKLWPNSDGGTTCPKCNMLWKGIMGYCCPDGGCPMGAGPTMFNAGSTYVITAETPPHLRDTTASS